MLDGSTETLTSYCAYPIARMVPGTVRQREPRGVGKSQILVYVRAKIGESSWKDRWNIEE